MSPNSKSSLAKNLQNWVKKVCVKTRMDRKGSVSWNWQYFILLQPGSLETKWTNSWDSSFFKFKFSIEKGLIFCSKYLILISKKMKHLIRPIIYIIFPNIARIVYSSTKWSHWRRCSFPSRSLLSIYYYLPIQVLRK